MKKQVRYALGAAGVMPALGLLAPAANATAAVTHGPRSGTKTVSLLNINEPLVNCGHNHAKHASNGPLAAGIGYSGTVCVHSRTRQVSDRTYRKSQDLFGRWVPGTHSLAGGQGY
jgi:hypothetical protein